MKSLACAGAIVAVLIVAGCLDLGSRIIGTWTVDEKALTEEGVELGHLGKAAIFSDDPVIVRFSASTMEITMGEVAREVDYVVIGVEGGVVTIELRTADLRKMTLEWRGARLYMSEPTGAGTLILSKS
jgi:hypothetical protein